MSVTLDTPHFPIGPCGPSKQSPFVGETSRHASTALLISALDCGENAGVRGRVAALSSKILRRVEGNDGSARAQVCIVLGGVREGEIGGLHLRTHRYKNTATHWREAQVTGPEGSKTNESAHVSVNVCGHMCVFSSA